MLKEKEGEMTISLSSANIVPLRIVHTLNNAKIIGAVTFSGLDDSR